MSARRQAPGVPWDAPEGSPCRRRRVRPAFGVPAVLRGRRELHAQPGAAAGQGLGLYGAAESLTMP
jgi:hypothetical protein